jgi:hypothetical protein
MIQNKSAKVRAFDGPPATYYCTLYVHFEGSPWQYFEVRVTANRAVVKTFKSCNLLHIVRFLAKFEIYQSSLQEALDIIETHGHNVVEFGMFGSPVGSRFEGSIH